MYILFSMPLDKLFDVANFGISLDRSLSIVLQLFAIICQNP